VTFCRSISCPWTETLIHFFGSSADGWDPEQSGVTFCGVGLSTSGTTYFGGNGDWGTVWNLSWTDGQWVEGVAYAFAPHETGSRPRNGVITDQSCNRYWGSGWVYELAGTQLKVLFNFPDGAISSQVTFDQFGNLIGGASNNYIAYVFQLIPESQGYWSLNTLYDFYSTEGLGTPTVDQGTGNIYDIIGS
jgi:hypothetical protein